jgi:hypothetical protein
MNVHRLLSAIAVAAAVLSLPHDAHATASRNKNLYPRCASTELSSQAIGGQTKSMQRLPIHPSELIIACIAADISTIGGSASDAACTIAHQTDYAYRLFINASYVDPVTNNINSIEYELKDVMGGSANRIHIRLPAAGTYELMFENQARSSSCVLKARAMLEVESGLSDASSTPAPVLVAVKPTVLYVESIKNAFFAFRHTRSSLGASADQVLLIESTRQCGELAASSADGLVLEYVPSDKATEIVVDMPDSMSLSVRKHYFDRTGTFRVCYALGASLSTWNEVAMLSVFSGNPSYYTFESGQGPQGQIYTNREITIRFHGFGLDTRPTGDQAKFVDEGTSCEDGAPAGGVRVATDLGPADDWGPNTKYTEWKWTLLSGGSFKVCYKRKEHAWVEVPSLAEVGPGAIDFTLPPQGPVPTPTDPISHEDCPMAPNGAENTRSYTSTILKVVLGTTKVPTSYLSGLSRALCLPVSAISIARQKSSDSGLQLWIDITCDTKGANDKVPCNAQERKNYAVHLAETNSPIAASLQWKSASQTSQDDIFAEADADGGLNGLLSNRKSRGAFLIGCATLLAVVGLTVFGVLKYKEKQHYFIQFGVDEDGDIDGEDGEELEIDDHGDIGRRKKPSGSQPYVADATIELED